MKYAETGVTLPVTVDRTPEVTILINEEDSEQPSGVITAEETGREVLSDAMHVTSRDITLQTARREDLDRETRTRSGIPRTQVPPVAENRQIPYPECGNTGTCFIQCVLLPI